MTNPAHDPQRPDPQRPDLQPSDLQRPAAEPHGTGATPVQPAPVATATAVAEPPTRSGPSVKLLLTIGLALALIAAGALVWLSRAPDRMIDAEVGECAQVVQVRAGDAEVERVDCDSPQANAMVTDAGDSVSCDVMESVLTERGAGRSLCVRPLLKKDTCYKVSRDAGNGFLETVSCQSRGNRAIKVAEVLTNTADPEKCPANSAGKSLSKRNIVYCLAGTE